jgi:hypothetical protein
VGSSEQGTPQDSSATAVVAAASPSSSRRLASFTAALKTLRKITVHRLTSKGLSVRVRCSRACSVRIDLLGRGSVKLAHLNGRLRKAGARTFTLHLSRKARRTVRRFHSGTLKLTLHLKSSDGERQTLSRSLQLKR